MDAGATVDRRCGGVRLGSKPNDPGDMLGSFVSRGDNVPFSESQKKAFMVALQSKGWVVDDGAIVSPSGGLRLYDSHFGHWSPMQMHEVFVQRAERIARAQIGDWQASTRENQDASLAATSVAEI
ncbi:MAG: hypothetical protein JSS49_26760 [Planctomycetes bacterium]|nr:hypothetical protein [Planctomycetota bacterium]